MSQVCPYEVSEPTTLTTWQNLEEMRNEWDPDSTSQQLCGRDSLAQLLLGQWGPCVAVVGINEIICVCKVPDRPYVLQKW